MMDLLLEQDRLNNSNEELSLSQDVITKRRSYQHQEALHKEELNSREEYLKAKEDYNLAVKKHALISKRLKKDAQLRRSQMEQMGDNLEAMQKNVQLVRQRKEKLNIRSTISGEIVAGPVGRNGCCQDFATATGCDRRNRRHEWLVRAGR